MSTRKLILAALLCGMAIMIAGAVWLLTLDSTVGDIKENGPPANVSTTLLK